MSGAIFPKLRGLAPGSGWQPEFSTNVQRAVSGKEYRAALMANPIYTLTLRYNFLRERQGELVQLLGFFLARRGSFDSFLYEHPDDHAVADQVIGVANGITRSFQLQRGIGSEFVEPVQNVKQIDVVKLGSSELQQGIDYTVSTTGMLLLAVVPSAGTLSWSGSYYYRARFADDNATYEKLMRQLWANKKVDLIASLGRRI